MRMRDHRNDNKENKRGRGGETRRSNMPIKQVFSSPEREHSSPSSSASPGIAFGLLHKDRYRLRCARTPLQVESRETPLVFEETLLFFLGVYGL